MCTTRVKPEHGVSIWQEFRKFGHRWPEVMVGLGMILTCAWLAALLWLLTLLF